MGEVANVPLEFIIVWNVGDINADGEPTEYAGRWMLRRLNRELWICEGRRVCEYARDVM
jgi:hypothetical protein